MARGRREDVLRLAEYSNKYCLTLWLFFGAFFLVYGDPLFRVWISAEFAANASVLLLILLVGQTFGLGQFTSGAILMGIGQYGEYSISLMVEAVVTVLGFGLALPFYGLPAAVAISSLMIFLNRCLNLSRIFARKFEIDQTAYLWRIYRAPMAVGILDVAVLWTIKKGILQGRNWRELITVGIVHAALFWGAAFWLVLEREHRALLLGKVEEKWRWFGYGFKRMKL
jgi:O-antigen/teichoic acid export membrane protein